ncbi:MAG: hypothetical protein KGJ13_09050 [Patescibacteria group bacterium]|nr:hypothetical protein [Patescibacteria group bacterium]
MSKRLNQLANAALDAADQVINQGFKPQHFIDARDRFKAYYEKLQDRVGRRKLERLHVARIAAGKKGGAARSERKNASSRANVALARAARERLRGRRDAEYEDRDRVTAGGYGHRCELCGYDRPWQAGDSFATLLHCGREMTEYRP